jgi:hypothetical protein
MDCLDLCCKNPEACTHVCPNHGLKFVQQNREVSGFSLDNIARTAVCDYSLAYGIVPLVYHGSRRAQLASGPVFALRLSDLVNFKKASLHYETREALCRSFGINENADIILTGVNHDHRIEPWWSLGEGRRVPLVAGLKNLGVKLVTAPNFSLVLDRPRTDDLHAIKRIGIVWAEFQQGGLACALHPNGRALRDFERWGHFISERSEIRVLAYEFITGSGQKHRQQFHLEGLAGLARLAGRPLDIVVRGDPNVIPILQRDFHRVIYIDTTAFMKTIKRKRAERVANDALRWVDSPTAFAGEVDSLYTHNLDEQIAFLRARYYAADAWLNEAPGGRS